MTTERTPGSGGTSTGPVQYAVRAATVEDATGIAEAHVASWRTAYRGLLPQALLDGRSVERRTAQWQRDIGGGDIAVHVATGPGGHVGGFVATERHGWQSDGTVKRDTLVDAEIVEVRYRRPLNGQARNS